MASSSALSPPPTTASSRPRNCGSAPSQMAHALMPRLQNSCSRGIPSRLAVAPVATMRLLHRTTRPSALRTRKGRSLRSTLSTSSCTSSAPQRSACARAAPRAFRCRPVPVQYVRARRAARAARPEVQCAPMQSHACWCLIQRSCSAPAGEIQAQHARAQNSQCAPRAVGKPGWPLGGGPTCERIRSINSGPPTPSGKPGKFSMSVVPISCPPGTPPLETPSKT